MVILLKIRFASCNLTISNFKLNPRNVEKLSKSVYNRDSRSYYDRKKKSTCIRIPVHQSNCGDIFIKIINNELIKFGCFHHFHPRPSTLSTFHYHHLRLNYHCYHTNLHSFPSRQFPYLYHQEKLLLLYETLGI